MATPNYTTGTREVDITFKLCYTNKIRNYHIPNDFTINQMYNTVLNDLYNSFHINPSYKIEFVEAGQELAERGETIEEKYSLIFNLNTSKIKQIYPNKNKKTFYVRIIRYGRL